MSSRDSLDSFLDTLKVHNKDIDACFNDALAEHHLKELVTAEIIAELERLAEQYGEFRDETTGKTIDIKAVTLYRIKHRINTLKAKETQL